MTIVAERQEQHSGFAPVAGGQLYYEVAGQGDALVLIHAGIADSAMWDAHLPTLARSHRVIRFDLRGFGQSPACAGPYSPRADLRALLDHLGVRRATLVGVSLGGALALDFALEYPALVDRLVLVGARPSGTAPSPELLRRWDEINDAEEAGDIARAVELELRLWVDGPRRSPQAVDPEVRERVRVMNTRNFALAVPDAAPQPLQPPALGRLSEVNALTLIVAGADDVADVVAAADLLEQGIPGARKVILLNAAHMLPMEHPALFNTVLLDFLKSG